MPSITSVPAQRFDNEELLTSRLSLRRPTVADVDAIFAIHADRRTSTHNPSDALATRDEAETLFKRWDEQWRRFGYGYWVLRRRGSAVPVGFCGIKTVEFKGGPALNLLCRLDPAAWGNGLGSEATTAVVEWATLHLPDMPVIARVTPENVASARVALKAGLVRAEELDSPGEDGIDWIFTSNWRRTMSSQ